MKNSTSDARAARASRSSAPVPTVGPWRLEGLIGAGQYTRVYRARPRNSAEDQPIDYALKVLRPEWTHESAAVQLMQREAFLGRQVSHPHLISVLDFDVDTPPFYIVTPYLAGPSLKQVMEATGRLPVTRALWIARQTAEALGELHEVGWFHGDVKPANIHVAADGHATLLDLGFARKIDESSNVLDRPLMGTLDYIAPELITSTVQADQRSDIYSLGATLFELLSGHQPFHSHDISSLAKAHLTERAPDPRRLRPDLPRSISSLIKQMMAKQPLRRPQSVDELQRAIARCEIESFEWRYAA